MDLGKKLAEGYAVDAEIETIEEPQTGPIEIVPDVRADAPEPTTV